MKKLLSAILCIFMLVSLCISLASCAKQETSNPIEFGKKYVNGSSSYVFNSDGTGVYEIHYSSSELDYVKSGSAEFVWREASNGGISLFQTSTKYNAENSTDSKIRVVSATIYFGEDFFTYETDSGTVRVVVEDSKLDKLMED